MDHEHRYSAPTGAAIALIVVMLAMAAGSVAVSRGWSPESGLNWGSLVGAVIGGTIAIIGQLVTISENRRQKLDKRGERNVGQAMSLLFKLVTI